MGITSYQIGFDREMAWYRGNSVRYLVASMTASTLPATWRTERPPVNLGLVIDASGSMQGARQASAKKAAEGIIEGLQERDFLSLVSFADDTVLHVNARHMDRAGRREAQTAVREMATRGCTDLAAGWLAGAEAVARRMQDVGHASNRVIILSDGHANRGNTDQEELGDIAANLRQRGLYTSAVGIGDGYCTDQLEAIANHGGGSLHDSRTPQDIVRVVLGELGEVMETASENLSLELVLPANVTVEVLGTYPRSLEDGRLTTSLGNLLSGASRDVVFKLTLPSGQADEQLEFQSRLSWREPGSDRPIVGPTQFATLTLVESARNGKQARDLRRSASVAAMWLAHVAHQAAGLNREAKYDEATSLLQEQLKHYTKYCKGVPATEKLVEEMRQLKATIDRPWTERARKDLHMEHRLRSRAQQDYRGKTTGDK